MAITRGAVAGPVFAGTGNTPLASLGITVGASMTGQLVVILVSSQFPGNLPSQVTVTDTQGNLYTLVSGLGDPTNPGRVGPVWVTDLTRGFPLSGADVITVTWLHNPPGPGVASLQVLEYHGADITTAFTHTSGFTDGNPTTGTTTGGAISSLGGPLTELAIVVHMRYGGDGTGDPSVGGTLTLNSGQHFSFVSSGDTGILSGGAVNENFRQYTYDKLPGVASTCNGHWGVIPAPPFLFFFNEMRVSFGPLPIGGVSLARSSAGHMFAAWQDRGPVYVARSLDQTDTWPIQKRIATDAATGASPWLTQDRHDDLVLLYHTAASFMSVWRLPDLLEGTPVNVASAHAYLFPCAVVTPTGLMIVAALSAGRLQVFQTPDYGVTMTLVKDYGVQAVERPALIRDRHGELHLFFRTTSDEIFCDYCPDPDGIHWLGAVLFQPSGCCPGLAAGPKDAFVTWFGPPDLAFLYVAQLGPDYHTLDHLAGAPAATFLPGSPGTLIDERDEWWFLGRLNFNSFGAAPPGSAPGDPGGGGAIIGGGGGALGDGFMGGAIGDVE